MNSQEYLEHFGILGMKWGRRKGKSKSSIVGSKDNERKNTLKKKRMEEMSNDELREFTKRLQLEKQYKDLSKSDVSSGRKFVTELITGTGKQMAASYILKYGTQGVEMLIKKYKR
jgi:ferredoxin-fold anticodon binding domain-containing protein